MVIKYRMFYYIHYLTLIPILKFNILAGLLFFALLLVSERLDRYIGSWKAYGIETLTALTSLGVSLFATDGIFRIIFAILSALILIDTVILNRNFNKPITL